ncbi:unnamed protein product [Spirodela intermedia]|uniref:Uncharacterized protein n=1 Tax=Spirodela intermedia TaxID=51605 RepID=A0A7I8JYJ5_SPIIN|nr:unnamed protein product [Spirodela intermedia]
MDKPGGERTEVPPPPPPVIPPNVIPIIADPELRKSSKHKRIPMNRPGTGTNGKAIPLVTNHFRVDLRNVDDGYFYHYSVLLKYDDDRPVDGRGIGRRVIDKLHEIYDAELGGKDFAYDGEKNLFTIGSLPQVNNNFTVVLEDLSSNRTGEVSNGSPGGNDGLGDSDRKRRRRPYQLKTFKVELSFSAKVPMRSIANALRGHENENSQEALRVLDIILRQHAAKQGCLLVRQSFFHNDPTNYTDLGGGVLGCRGFHSSFRTTQGGLSLNMDVSTTMIVKPGSVIDFLIANQKARNCWDIDWVKAKRTLKNLRVKITSTNMEFKIVGLSDQPCNQLMFSLKQKNRDVDTIDITVYDYFTNHRHIKLKDSADLPCLNVGKPKRPTYYPLELCSLVPLQRYTKALSTFQRSSLVEKSRQKPQEKMRVLKDSLKNSHYDADRMLKACGVCIGTDFMQVEGRVLQAPKLRVGNGQDLMPYNGRWNFNNRRFVEPATIDQWAVVNFSARCDIGHLIREMKKCGRMKGINIEEPSDVFEEDAPLMRAPPNVRVDKMFDKMMKNLPASPLFLLCILPERKNSDIYGPWKRRNLTEFGIVTQCIAPPPRISDQYITNVLLKINSKLGGINSLLHVEIPRSSDLVSGISTIILGMDVSHGPPGQSDIPSVAAVVGSRQWPSISRYRAAVRTQSPKLEMIDSLFKPVSDKDDSGIIRELLVDFYLSSQSRKPAHVIIFRDGVSESQFNQVLNIELDQIIEACKFLDDTWHPKFTVIVAQKNHHTKFFQPDSKDNVPPGTVVDTKVCHPRNFDFYMCSHAGMIGTTRPTHYHVLYDEIGFSADKLQELVHSLSYVYQRSTTAVSLVAPICYAHLAAAQVGQFIRFEESSETSGRGDVTSAGSVPVVALPRLHSRVCESMFFC